MLQSLVSHDPLEIIPKCWFGGETYIIIINVKNCFAA